MRASDRYQIALIALGIVVTLLLSVFFYREIFPEYKLYQNDYIALEQFRSTYTHEALPGFKTGVKQLVFEREDKGPAKIDRCTSCHVALELPHFSPTTLAKDPNGNIIKDQAGAPLQVPNENYVFKKLQDQIALLEDKSVNQRLEQQGLTSELKDRQKQADIFKSLMTAKVNGLEYNVETVLKMHPLIGNETRPFEFHPIEEYGCTSCHSGNGRALTTNKAHGPVFDGFYEAEFTGHKKEFTEKDPDNDPQFAKIFNHKPGDDLLFQTTPILVGSLIQAKCVQCHIPKTQDEAKNHDDAKEQNISFNVDTLTKDFQRGKELFIAQGCYACHRIAKFSRGGIGPDLTHSGDSYPWFLKSKLVSPQADLKTSTMPNYKLDTRELEDLMTFLLAQKGATKAESDVEYKIAVQRWENTKEGLEKPLNPQELFNLEKGMTIFATEGCAACHRLKGFESDIGFAKEKEANASFEALYQEHEWFQKLFPEETLGSSIVSTLETHADEIDKRIVSNVRQGSLLEKIEKNFPDLIESFYSNFRYASRAKDHYFQMEIGKAKEGNEKQSLLNAHAAWKEKVHRILMMYIQEYGYGRLIGPKPNWSGIYRTDEWLMEHFKNPSSHQPRSIMPVFPFDESKFLSLTFMLNAIGKKNKDAIALIFEKNGFDPELAYMIHCADCHGHYLQGNGPIAEWIYPIPKNLRNANFLRNLTKENAIVSITHGVKGTPMPPWGENAKATGVNDHDGVLNHEQIKKLVDWLFSFIPSENATAGAKEVLKWNYTAKDVIEELSLEGATLKGDTKIPFDEDYKESTFFNAIADGQTYIKQEYYTEGNIEAGKMFFELNCAVCHGSDADGAGARASIMVDAKPRMLTNLDWLHTRDDLRLLRSIKYGVAGTAMTPWGDFTSSLQRLQLVIFIRSLTLDKLAKDALNQKIYSAFIELQNKLNEMRYKEYQAISTLYQKQEDINTQLKQVEKMAGVDSKGVENALSLYQKMLSTSAKLRQRQALDLKFVDLKKQIDSEKERFLKVGQEILNNGLKDSPIFTLFLEMIDNSRPTVEVENDTPSFSATKTKQATEIQNKIIAALTQLIDDTKKDESAKKTSYSKLRESVKGL